MTSRTMRAEPLTLRPAQLLFSFWLALFSFILVNGYALNLLRLPADPWVILVLVAVEFAGLAVWFVRARVRVSGDPLELAGFVLVVAGVYIYFLIPSLPTLLPPSYSTDAVNHLAHANAVVQTGRIIGDYPGGGALLIATIARWLGALPLRVVHPLATFWIALMAGGVYLLAGAMLPARRERKTLALFAAFALFVPWIYFGGMLIQYQYFSTQVAAQLFLVAFVGFLGEYRDARQPVWLIGMALCLISISVLFQLWLAVPVALLGAYVFSRSQAVWTRMNAEYAEKKIDEIGVHPRLSASTEWREILKRALLPALVVVGALALFWLAIWWWGSEFIPQVARLGAGGAITPPSLPALGGAFLALPLLGVLLSWNAGYRVWLPGAFLILVVLQCLAALGARALGVSDYWIGKTFYLLILPLALFSVIPLARAVEWGKSNLHNLGRKRLTAPHPSADAADGRAITSSAFFATFIALASLTLFFFPPPRVSILDESDIQVALWAKEHLDTRHIHYISRKSLVANWLVELWGESVPDDLLIDLATLGPKTFEEWRADPAWGEYLFVAAGQRLPRDPALRVLYQRGDSLIAQKPDAPRPALGEDALAQVGDVFALLDYTTPARSLRAGETLSLTAQLGTQDAPAHAVVWRLQLRDLENHAAAEARLAPFADKFPLQRWPDRVTLTQSLTLTLPIDIRPGVYALQLGLYYAGSGAALPVRTSDGAADDVIHLSQIKIALPPTTAHELAATTRAHWQLGDAFALVGYRLKNVSSLKPGDRFTTLLYWQCRAVTAQDYTVFVHLIDAAGRLVAQNDSAPRRRTYPTSIWSADEIIPDAYDLIIPGDAAPGDYRIQVGMYAFPDLRRLPAADTETRASDDHIELPVHVTVW